MRKKAKEAGVVVGVRLTGDLLKKLDAARETAYGRVSRTAIIRHALNKAFGK